MHIKENTPLAPYTTFGIGGPARWFVEAASEDEIVEGTAWAQERGLTLFVLGGGSNLLVADGGFDGLVLRIALRGSRFRRVRRERRFIAPRPAKTGTTACSGPWRTIALVWSVWRAFRERWAELRCRTWARTGRRLHRSSNGCVRSPWSSGNLWSLRRRNAGLPTGAAGSIQRIAAGTL